MYTSSSIAGVWAPGGQRIFFVLYSIVPYGEYSVNYFSKYCNKYSVSSCKFTSDVLAGPNKGGKPLTNWATKLESRSLQIDHED